MEVHRCPVCNGNGLVPNGFYLGAYGSWGCINTNPERCRSCNGKGFVIAETEKGGEHGQ